MVNKVIPCKKKYICREKSKKMEKLTRSRRTHDPCMKTSDQMVIFGFGSKKLYKE